MTAAPDSPLAHWGDVTITGPTSGGAVNNVVFATVNGNNAVIRRARASEASLRWELELLADLRRAGLAVPGVIASEDGRDTIEGIVVFERVQGRPPSASDWPAVRDYLSRLHQLGSRPQRPGVRSATDLLTASDSTDIDLTAMPDEAARRCRAAWARLEHVPPTVIHGDPGETNVLVGDDGPVLIDWDEARVDAPHFDLAALSDDVCPLVGRERWTARQAASAWEAAISWRREPSYAKRRLAELADEPPT